MNLLPPFYVHPPIEEVALRLHESLGGRPQERQHMIGYSVGSRFAAEYAELYQLERLVAFDFDQAALQSDSPSDVAAAMISAVGFNVPDKLFGENALNEMSWLEGFYQGACDLFMVVEPHLDALSKQAVQ